MNTKRFFIATLAAVAATLLFTGESHAGGGNCQVRERSCGTNFAIVDAYSSNHYSQVFRRGEAVILSVVGDGDTDLDVYVYDEYYNLIASDTDATDVCVVSWIPCRTSVYHIEVENLGCVYNEYRIRLN